MTNAIDMISERMTDNLNAAVSLGQRAQNHITFVVEQLIMASGDDGIGEWGSVDSSLAVLGTILREIRQLRASYDSFAEAIMAIDSELVAEPEAATDKTVSERYFLFTPREYKSAMSYLNRMVEEEFDFPEFREPLSELRRYWSYAGIKDSRYPGHPMQFLLSQPAIDGIEAYRVYRNSSK